MSDPGDRPGTSSPGPFHNVYHDQTRADAYATLEFPGTYGLAFRDIPALLRTHVRGRTALDFGCGAGRSTRFLHTLGFDVVGVDISAPMLARARAHDPGGSYHLIAEGGPVHLPGGPYDVILSAFAFDNIPTLERKVAILTAIRGALAPGGRFLNLVATPEAYRHEWVSFSTRDFPENRTAQSGDRVRVVMLDVEDRRPVEDVLCSDEDYRTAYARAGLAPLAVHRPLGTPADGVAWTTELTVSPWAIYVLAASEPPAAGGA